MHLPSPNPKRGRAVKGGHGRTHPFLQKPCTCMCLSHQPFLKGIFYWLSISQETKTIQGLRLCKDKRTNKWNKLLNCEKQGELLRGGTVWDEAKNQPGLRPSGALSPPRY